MKNILKKQQTKSGFTLIEILVVIAIMAILAAIVFVALNPLARFQDARNDQRWTDVKAILDAVKLYQLDNDGAHCADIQYMAEDQPLQIGLGENCDDTCSDSSVTLVAECLDIDGYLTGVYLEEDTMPVDPNASGASEDETRYYLTKNANGTITVGACGVELGSNDSIPVIKLTQ